MNTSILTKKVSLERQGSAETVNHYKVQKWTNSGQGGWQFYFFFFLEFESVRIIRFFIQCRWKMKSWINMLQILCAKRKKRMKTLLMSSLRWKICVSVWGWVFVFHNDEEWAREEKKNVEPELCHFIIQSDPAMQKRRLAIPIQTYSASPGYCCDTCF